MSVHYRSDRDGADIPDALHRRLSMRVTIDSTYIDEPIKYDKHWDMTASDYQSLIPDAITMRNAIEAAAVAFMNAVENPE